MNRLVNGNNNFYYASVIGGQGLTSDNVIDTGTGHSLSYDINYLENNIGSASLTGDITIGTNFSNTISVNSGSTIYNNAEIVKFKDNTSASLRLQCNDASPTDLMILNTTNGAESMYLPLKYTEIGNVASGGVQIGDGTNVGATNIYGVVSLKNATDSTTYSSVDCSNCAGGLSVYKKINVGGNITSQGTINGTTINGSSVVSSGAISGTNITLSATTASTTTGTGAIICAGGVGIGGALNVGGAIVSATVQATGSMACSNLSALNLYLPTTGGNSTALNYYEEITISVALAPSGGGSYLFNGSCYVTRLGKIIFFRLPTFSGSSNTQGGYIVGSVLPLPTRLRPPATVNFLIPVSISNGTTGVIQSAPGMIQILSTGVINIFSSPSGAGTFTSGNGSQPVGDVFISWSIV